MRNSVYKIYLLLALIFYSITLCQSLYVKNQSIYHLTVPASRWTFFELDDNGSLKLNNEGLPYQSTQEIVTINVDLSPKNTAFFVIDPWNNMPSDFLNQYFGKITENYILPLIKRANEKNFPVYIFTNDCKTIKPVPTSCEIPQQFYLMAKKYSTVQILCIGKISIFPCL